MAAFSAARERVLAAVSDACRRAGRDPAGVQLVAVSKTVPAARLDAAVAAGLTVLGENRVQEAEAKAPLLPGARWHLIGPLQSNKARRAVELFDVIESVDSVELARRLDRLAGELGRAPLGAYLQVNVDRDEAKAGFRPEVLETELGGLVELPNLRLLGLMTVGRLVDSAEEARPTFGRLRELSELLRGAAPGLGTGLSMGMTDDYPVAVEEGATVIRVGRALFGARPIG
ncbi:MAG: YggS family pyridoxal phosphate-dependent enzyme [Candidatus Limnocylindrales bacterium]|jgi:pyridoxal phosphate enzyme (YggS family)